MESGLRDSEFGIRNSEFGTGNSELGLGNSEFGSRKLLALLLAAAAAAGLLRAGQAEVMRSGEATSHFGVRNY